MITKRERSRFLVIRSLSFTTVLTLSVLLFSCTEKVADQEALVAKEVSNASENDDIWIEVWEVPTFKGKDVMEFSKWVKERIEFPDDASLNGIEGKAFIGFCVEADGSVSNVTVLLGLHKLIDDEVLRVVKTSPKWEPGRERDVPIRVRCSIAVPFPPN